ncbi:MAG: hypothetical protein D6730_22425 [Bacteroidetes bacterium]|nr:MAG: hypothetical protein D6730_22425 [Bacteroidota bacterium]
MMHNLKYLTMVLALMAALAGCSKPEEIELGETFSLNFEQKKQIPSEGLEVQFLRVTADTRCPTNVTCVTAGFVTVEIQLWKAGQDLGTHSVSKGEGIDAPYTEVDAYRVELIDVHPYPTDPQPPIPQESYSIELRVNRR